MTDFAIPPDFNCARTTAPAASVSTAKITDKVIFDGLAEADCGRLMLEAQMTAVDA